MLDKVFQIYCDIKYKKGFDQKAKRYSRFASNIDEKYTYAFPFQIYF